MAILQESSGKKIPEQPPRRAFFARLLSGGLFVSLVTAYGGFASLAARFLYPPQRNLGQWLYVGDLDRLGVEGTIQYTTPSGATVVIARQADDVDAVTFTALSDVCPHLGCKVHWQSRDQRYFCPCHNGVFDSTGKGTGGPPGEQGLDLIPYNLKVEGNLLFIELAEADLIPSTTGALRT